ncbi:ATP-binding protein, partial [mine drainage metagenome]
MKYTFVFVGRRKELAYLEEKYLEDRSNMILIYGRRRIGKTALVTEFVRNKRALYLLATQEEKSQVVKGFSQRASEYFKDSFLQDNPFSDWDSLFRYIIEKIKSSDSKIVLVFDEVTYLIEQDKSFLSLMQKYYDLHLKNLNVMLILTGSLVNVVYNDILDYNSPLFGRRTGNIELSELRFPEIRNFFPDADVNQLVKIYSVYGGVPYYLGLLGDGSGSIEKFLNRNNVFYTDVQFILSQELRTPDKYFSILKLIANGKNSISEISSSMEVNSNELSPYLDKLISMKVISKEFPLTAKRRNNGVYRITSNYFNFYFRFVFEKTRLVETGNETTLIRYVNDNMDMYISKVFEDICNDFILEFSERLLGAKVDEIGRWWGKNPRKDQGKEIEEIA